MKNEVRPIDANATIEALRANFQLGSWYGCEDPLYQIAEDTISEMPTLTDHFPGVTKMMPLTLEQLQEMDGQPAWCADRKEWGIIHIDPDGPWANVPFFRGVYCDLDVKHNGLTLYAYPPAHIDREASEIKKAMIDINNLAVSYIENGPYENDLPGMEFAVKVDRISKAWAELEKRLRGMRT